MADLLKWFKDRKDDVVDIFDANTEEDQRKRVAKGQPRLYADQQRAMGNKRPMTNLGQQVVGNTARMVNTGAAAVNELIDTTRLLSAQATGNTEAWKNANRDIQERQKVQYRPDSGILGAGTIFNSPEEFKTLGADELAKRVASTTVGAAGEVVPVGRGLSLSGKNVTRSALAKGALQGAAAGAAADVGQQYINTGKINPIQTAFAAGTGGALTVAPPAIASSLRKTAPAARQASTVTTKTLQDINNRAFNAESNPRVTAFDPQYEQLQRSYDATTDAVARRRISNAMAQNRQARADEIEKIRQGGYVRSPLASGDSTPEQLPLFDRTRQSPRTSVSESNVGRQDRVSASNPPASQSMQRQGHSQRSAIQGRPLEIGDAPSDSLSRSIPLSQAQQSSGRSIQPQAQAIQNSSFPQSVAQDAEQRVFANNPTSPDFSPDNPIEPLESVGDIAKERVNVLQRGGQKQVPVSRVEQEGRRVTKTNVKTGKEQRFTVDDNGELLPDTNGAYRIFTDNEGRVKQLRIGDEVFDAKDLGDLTEVNGYGSTLATIRRNIERAFGKETGEKVNRFLVDHQQAQATKLIERQIKIKQDMQQLANELGISFGVGSRRAKKVSAAIQDYGEGIKTKAQLIDEFGKDYANKIVAADKWFRTQYDTLLDEMNATLTKYGYDAIPKRKNYYTHFQEQGLWRSFGLKMQELRALGSPTMQDALPDAPRGKISNKLAGESEFTQPNKRFNPFALRREGDSHTSDAFQAFERYLTPTLNNIYMTPSITRARVLTKAIATEADIANKDANKTIVQIKEWANHLAGKSNRLLDRQASDTDWGQKYLRATQFLQRKAGQNAIVGNLATAALQPIVLAQSTGKFGTKNILLAAAQEMSTAHGKNAPIRQSAFMKRRYADLMPVTAGKIDRARDMANAPLHIVEETAARITWNAAHNDALSQGLKGKAAIRYADIETEKTLAGRSIGERPELFTSKTAAPFTMFQLEVNNFWQQFGKEMTKAQAARTLIAAFAFNLALEQATGRNVGFNPIDAAIDSYQDLGDEEASVGEKIKNVAQRFAGEVVDNVPIVAPLLNAGIGDNNLRALLGETSNAGRFGVSSPIGSIVDNPWYTLSPFGGAQAKKTIGGLQDVIEGESVTGAGNKRFDIEQSGSNAVRAGLFGSYATNEGKAYIKEKDANLRGTSNNDQEEPKQAQNKYDLVLKAYSKNSEGQVKVTDYDTKQVTQAINDISSEANEEFARRGLPQIKLDSNSAKIWARYAKGDYTSLQREPKAREAIKGIYKTQIGADARTLLGMSDRDIRGAIADGSLTEEAVREAVFLDNLFYDTGLSSSLAIGNTIRQELGVDGRYRTTAKRKRSGSGGRKNTGMTKLNEALKTMRATKTTTPDIPLRASKVNPPRFTTEKQARFQLRKSNIPRRPKGVKVRRGIA